MPLGLPPDVEAQKAHDLLEDPVQPALFGELYIRRAGDRNEFPSGLQHLEGLFERVLPQAVQDHVVAIQDLREILFLVVDDDIRAETSDQIDIRRAGRRRYRCADVLCQLDGKRADPAGTAVDQDLLSLLQLGAFDQYLPRGQAHQGDGGGLFHGEILGLQRHVGFIHCDAFRERPDPVLVWPCIHLVTRLETSDLGTDTDHYPGNVVAQD